MKHLVEIFLAVALGNAVALASSVQSQEASPRMDECSSAGFSARAANLDQELGTRPLAEVQGEVMMRIGPSFSCERKYLIPAGGTVQLHACQGDWCLVSYGTETGYLPVAALDRVPNLAPDGPEE